MICHNHPGLTSFSANDINVFFIYKSIKIMSIVTNQGKVKYISKLDNFSISKAREIMSDLRKKYNDDVELCVENLLKQGYNFGIEVY